MQQEFILLRAELLRLKAACLAIALDRAMARIAAGLKAYDPAQPRVPAGDPDGGQWVGGGPPSDLRGRHRSPKRQRLASSGIVERSDWVRIDINSNFGFYPINDGTKAIVNMGSRTPPKFLSIDSPLIQNAPINANDNRKCIKTMWIGSMSQKAIFQPNFRISDAARERILALARQCRDEKQVEVVPCLSMMLKRDNAWLPENVPVVGFYEQGEVEQGDVATVDGVAFVFAVGHEGAAIFAGKTLVHDEGGFRLI